MLIAELRLRRIIRGILSEQTDSKFDFFRSLDLDTDVKKNVQKAIVFTPHEMRGQTISSWKIGLDWGSGPPADRKSLLARTKSISELNTLISDRLRSQGFTVKMSNKSQDLFFFWK